jgi:hypothetical protein
MVKPAFDDLEIDFWVHPGKLGVAQPSLCVFHNTPKMGTQFLEALTELRDQTCPAKRTLTFTACSRNSALRKLTFMLIAESEDLRVLNIRRDLDTATIEMTDIGLSLLIDAFSSWLAGTEDFGVSPRHSSLTPKQFGRLDRESGEIWFWGPNYAGP